MSHRGGLLRAAAAVGLLLTLGAAITACEWLTARNGLQCTTAADCRSRPGAFAQSLCSADGVCVPVAPLPEAGIQSGASCLRSEDCTVQYGPSRCISARCVPLEQQGCIVSGPVSDDDAVLVGVLVPGSGQAATLSVGIGLPVLNNRTGQGTPLVEQILAGWNSLPAPPNGSPAPLFGAVICDESQLVAQSDAGYSALLAFLQQIAPQMFVGTVSSNALSTLVQAFPQTPIFAPLGDDSSFATPSSTLHTWTCSPNRANLVADFQDAIARLSSFILAQPNRGPKIKIAIAYNSNEPSELHFFKCLTGASPGCAPLTWAGSGSTATSGEYNAYDLDVDVDNGAGQPLLVGEQVAAFAPDLVVITGPIMAESVITQIDDRWLGGPLPTYLVFRETDQLADFTRNPLVPLTGATVDGGPSLNRVFGLDLVPDTALATNLATFDSSIVSLLIDPDVETHVASPFYDCMNVAMYATAAAAVHASKAASLLTPAEIASGVSLAATDTPTGVPPNIDETSVILSLLNGANKTALAGTSMYYGLDGQTGIPTLQLPPAPVGVSCIDQTHSWVSAGVLYGSTGPDGGSAVVSCP